MNDLKVATILFRVFGVSDIAYAVFSWPYNLLMFHFSERSALIAATLCDLVYVCLGLFLIILSKRLAALVVRGLG